MAIFISYVSLPEGNTWGLIDDSTSNSVATNEKTRSPPHEFTEISLRFLAQSYKLIQPITLW